MKNTRQLLFVLPVLIAVGLGCSSVTEMVPEEVKTAANVVTTSPESPEKVLREKTGVPECDQIIDSLADDSKANDDNYVTRAAKEMFFNKIRQSIKETVETSKNNPKEMAKKCTEFKKQLDAFVAEEKAAATK